MFSWGFENQSARDSIVNYDCLDDSQMIEALFFIPVAPRDAERASWAVKSIRAYCKNYKIYLLLNGALQTSLPDDIFGSDVQIEPNIPPTKDNWGKIWLMQCTAMCKALHRDDLSPNAIFVKMDADALIIRGGMIERAQTIFATRPAAGQIGQCFSGILGGRFINAGRVKSFRTRRGWGGLLRFVISAMRSGENWHEGLVAYFRFRNLVRTALEKGYLIGHAAAGGCYILRKEFVAAFARMQALDGSPFRFLPQTGEDVIMTLYVYAAGYSAVDDGSDGGLFAIESNQGFRLNPFTLKARGHYILHPLKCGYKDEGYNLDEEELINALLK